MLASCPFCGSDKVGPGQYLTPKGGPRYVTCWACAARGPVEIDKAEAEAAWNRRTKSATEAR
jgi:Lar family restriction alleviation protein